MSQAIAQGFPVFTDANGLPLENGYVYIGTSGSDAQTNAINVYWDSALSNQASQPLRTNGGFLTNNGAPGNIFVSPDSYSITVRDKNGVLVYANTVSPAPSEVQAGNIDSDTATNGQVLTADGSGGASWQTAAAGSTNLSVTAFGSTVDVESDTGTNATIPAATTGAAGVLTSSDKTKLDGIEALADVTDADNVASAGATMDADTDVSANGWVLDEDDMVSDDATKVPTQQSVKAFVEANSGVDGTKGTIETLSSSSGTPDTITIVSNKILRIDVFWGTAGASTVSSWCYIDPTDDSFIGSGGQTGGTTITGTITGSFIAAIPASSSASVLIDKSGSTYRLYEDSSFTDVDVTYIWL